MPRKKRTKSCVYCDGDFETINPNQVYCSHRCAGFGNNAMRGNGQPLSKEHKRKISDSLKRRNKGRSNPQKGSKEHSLKVGNSTIGKYRKTPPMSIMELSTRTRTKVIQRLEIGCSQCGYDRCIGHLHHIQGKKVKDADQHRNLSYVCSRCHDEIHAGLIPLNDIVTFETQVGQRWLDCYFG